jgi:hypothetical protein
MEYVCHFFAGAFLCNCIPHLVAGLQGAPFPTPFAKPRGVGNSSPPVNFLWGSFNLPAGVALLSAPPVRSWSAGVRPNEQVVDVIEFETADPAMQGEMTTTITLADAEAG